MVPKERLKFMTVWTRATMCEKEQSLPRSPVPDPVWLEEFVYLKLEVYPTLCGSRSANLRR